MCSSRKHLEAVIFALGDKLRERDSFADRSFLELDNLKELSVESAKP